MEAEEFNIPTGLVCVEEYTVGNEHTASHIGSGDVRVLATPFMIAFMERTAMNCVQSLLPREYTTVGVHVDVKHLNPAPQNSRVKIEVKLLSRDKRKLLFEVKAYYKDTLIGEGKHERFIVNRDRFIEKLRRIMMES